MDRLSNSQSAGTEPIVKSHAVQTTSTNDSGQNTRLPYQFTNPHTSTLAATLDSSAEERRAKVEPYRDPEKRPGRQDDPRPNIAIEKRLTKRPGHLHTKSASAVPTLSTLNAQPEAAPSPPRSPAKCRPVSRSWLSRPASTMSATQHEGQLNSNVAADLLRQAMMHG